jgi:hypothetical protein
LNQRYEELISYDLTTKETIFDGKFKNERYSPYANLPKKKDYLDKTKTELNISEQFINIYQTDRRTVDSKVYENSFFTSVCFSNLSDESKEKVWRPW